MTENGQDQQQPEPRLAAAKPTLMIEITLASGTQHIAVMAAKQLRDEIDAALKAIGFEQPEPEKKTKRSSGKAPASARAKRQSRAAKPTGTPKS